jgi:outer membrane protein insertion porin family
MKKIILIFFIFCAICSNASAQGVVNSINITGNEFFSTSDILSSMSSKRNAAFSKPTFNADLKAIRGKYRAAGYLQAEIRSYSLKFSADSQSVDINIDIAEGQIVKIGKINFRGNKFFSEAQLLEIFETKTNEVLNDNRLNNDITTLLKAYESNSIPFSKAIIRDISIYYTNGKPYLKIDIDITEGTKIRIDEIKIRGNESTNDNVITRELRLKSDRTITREILESFKRRLENLNIFERVEEPKVYTVKSTNKTGLLVEVKEGNTNTFDGVLGYMPPVNDNEKGYFTGLVNVSFRNIFGTGRRLDAKWQQEVRSTQVLEFRYTEPYIFSLPLNINAGFQQRIQDSTYTKRNIDIKGELIITDKFSGLLLGGYERIIPSTDSNAVSIVSDSRTFYTGLELRYDSRDYIYNPASGIVFDISYSYGDKKIFAGEGSNYSIQKFGTKIDLYHSFFKRQSVLLALSASQVTTGHLEDADYIRVGGNINIRGYREEQFLATKLAYGNFEFRYSIARRSYIYALFDAGYYFKGSDVILNSPEQKDFIFGYGFGIQIESGIGIIGINYALGRGDTFLDGKIHFGIINNF